MRVVDVPEVVRRTAVQAGASDWLEHLPILIEDLERDWQILVGPAFGGGTESYVAEARLDDGTEAVLKLHMPRDPRAVQDELRALRLAEGVGCARLLRDDADQGAALLERLGPTLSELRLPIGRRHEILCATVQQFWRPVPTSGLRSGADQAERLSALVRDQWEALDRPCTERVVAQALAAAAQRRAAHDEGRAVLVHGDVHQWNTLEAAAGFKLVDPDGLQRRFKR